MSNTTSTTTIANNQDTLTLRRIDGAEWNEDWDVIAGQQATAGFMQSSFWAEFKRAEGYTPLRYGFFRDETLIGGATLLDYPAAPGQPNLLLCPEGPVLPWDDTETTRNGLRQILRAAERDAGSAVGLRIEPHLPPSKPSVLRNWQRAPLDLAPLHTLMVDISRSNDDLLAQMKPKGRYNLRLAHRHGVMVRQSERQEDLRLFYDLFEDTSRRQEFFGEPYGFFLNLGATLFPKQHASLFIAEWQGIVLAASVVIFYGRRATYLYGGSSPLHRNVMPCYALHFAAIEEARRRGCTEYDFWGIDPFGLPDHLYAGFSQFKRQWGGEVVASLGAHDHLFYDRLAGHILTHLTANT
jgi:peptidoglycan pentaglycine glycine transferase (the first glycine)